MGSLLRTALTKMLGANLICYRPPGNFPALFRGPRRKLGATGELIGHG
jgi:hypothetical protein